ncbi:hypothetical protein, partial [Pseudomonas sp. NPDC007930]|uniref:hypothetical protein n=1 Tax=Pseudomonas sp. NPDC007930 TaxID=3364417 RepID=UPI0036EAC6C3
MNDRWQSVAQFKEGLGLTGEQSVQFDRLNRQFQGWPLAMIYPGEVLLVGDCSGLLTPDTSIGENDPIEELFMTKKYRKFDP